MRVVCCFCARDLGTKAPRGGGVTHGMCAECDQYFARQWAGLSWGEYLDRFDFPVMLVDADVRVVAANRAAGAMLGRDPASMLGLLGGEAMECVRARLPGGCGKTVHCSACAIRNAVTHTRRTGRPLSRVPARLRRREGPVDLLVSTAVEGPAVRVSVEPPGRRADAPAASRRRRTR